MVTVVNHLRLSAPIPDAAFEAVRTAFPGMRELGCLAFEVVRVADDHAILILVLRDAEAAAAVSRTYGGPWMNEHVRPLLSGETERYVGDVVCSLGRDAPGAE
jgi:hypothetical protein